MINQLNLQDFFLDKVGAYMCKNARTKTKLVFSITETKRPLIGIINRDSCYSGNGQPWRDSDIQKYKECIYELVSLGFSVVRLNSVGYPLNISSQYVTDLATSDCTVEEQFSLMSSLDLFVGTATGASEFPSQLFMKPSLWIDSSIMYQVGYSHRVVHVPKRLSIYNEDLFRSRQPSQLLRYLLRSPWTDFTAHDFGLRIEPLNIHFITQTIIQFVNYHKAIRTVYHSLHDLFSDSSHAPEAVDILVDSSTYDMVKTLLSLNRGSYESPLI